MINTFQDLVHALERYAERSELDGDIDLQQIESLIASVQNFEAQITPDLAERCHTAIESLYSLFEHQMKDFIQSFGSIRESRRALRGYHGYTTKSQPVRVYRNV